VRIVLCGVRGSTPASGREFVRVGGHTSCVALCRDGEDRPRLVLDAGTGLRAVTDLLSGAPFDGSILLGHLHWDHTQGLPFFRGGDHPAARTRVLLPAQGTPAIDLVSRFMSPPAFPIGPLDLRGAWSFESLEEGEREIEGFQLLAREIPHKGGRTFGYRVSDGLGTVTYLSDHGPYGAFGPGPDGWGPYHESATALCSGSDLLIHDAEHTAQELPAVASFGHSAADYAVGLAHRCGVPRVLLFHHDPSRTDDEVDAIERSLGSDTVRVEAAREGVTIEVRSATQRLPSVGC
jgi:phosphoribosyl 1,2-cyclic phosphodiesterase